jgi:hypothetical protein
MQRDDPVSAFHKAKKSRGHKIEVETAISECQGSHPFCREIAAGWRKGASRTVPTSLKWWARSPCAHSLTPAALPTVRKSASSTKALYLSKLDTWETLVAVE